MTLQLIESWQEGKDQDTFLVHYHVEWPAWPPDLTSFVGLFKITNICHADNKCQLFTCENLFRI